MIPTVREPEELQKQFKVYEGCFFCKKPTPLWHWRTNQPVCKGCAAARNVSELPKCTPDYKPPTKKQYLSPPPPTTGGKKKYMPKGEFKRYKVVAAFPTMKDWLLDVDDVVMDDGVQAVRNHKGHPVFPVKWEAFPKIFEEIEPCGQKEYDEAFNKWLNEK